MLIEILVMGFFWIAKKGVGNPFIYVVTSLNKDYQMLLRMQAFDVHSKIFT